MKPYNHTTTRRFNYLSLADGKLNVARERENQIARLNIRYRLTLVDLRICIRP